MFMLLFFTACGLNTSKKGNTVPEVSSSSQKYTSSAKKESKYYFKDNTAKLKDIKLKITKTKIIKAGDKGNEYGENTVIAFWFSAKNIGGIDIDPNGAWLNNIEAYQDTSKTQINTLKVGWLPDKKFLKTQQEKIKSGATADSAMSYELSDTKTPVILKLTDHSSGKVIGSQKFELK